MRFLLNIQFFGRGPSKAGGGGAAGGVPIEDFPEAFKDGKDFIASGEVEHEYSRRASASVDRQWKDFADEFGERPWLDEDVLYKEFDPSTRRVYGYIRTSNSGKINELLYDPKNDGKTDEEIFTRKDRSGRLRDLETVRALDKNIESHSTPRDASYTRFCDSSTIKAAYGLTDSQFNMLMGAGGMSASQLSKLNKAFVGRSSFSKSYTSTSGNRSLNAFQKFTFERKINVPKGTKAFAARNNSQESEVIFGRGMKTKITGITVRDDGHIVIHEMFDGYR